MMHIFLIIIEEYTHRIIRVTRYMMICCTIKILHSLMNTLRGSVNLQRLLNFRSSKIIEIRIIFTGSIICFFHQRFFPSSTVILHIYVGKMRITRQSHITFRQYDPWYSRSDLFLQRKAATSNRIWWQKWRDTPYGHSKITKNIKNRLH